MGSAQWWPAERADRFGGKQTAPPPPSGRSRLTRTNNPPNSHRPPQMRSRRRRIKRLLVVRVIARDGGVAAHVRPTAGDGGDDDDDSQALKERGTTTPAGSDDAPDVNPRDESDGHRAGGQSLRRSACSGCRVARSPSTPLHASSPPTLREVLVADDQVRYRLVDGAGCMGLRLSAGSAATRSRR